jgi:hypothetical protein
MILGPFLFAVATVAFFSVVAINTARFGPIVQRFFTRCAFAILLFGIVLLDWGITGALLNVFGNIKFSSPGDLSALMLPAIVVAWMASFTMAQWMIHMVSGSYIPTTKFRVYLNGGVATIALCPLPVIVFWWMAKIVAGIAIP